MDFWQFIFYFQTFTTLFGALLFTDDVVLLALLFKKKNSMCVMITFTFETCMKPCNIYLLDYLLKTGIVPMLSVNKFISISANILFWCNSNLCTSDVKYPGNIKILHIISVIQMCRAVLVYYITENLVLLPLTTAVATITTEEGVGP